MRKHTRNDCGHCSTGPSAAVDQSSAHVCAHLAASGEYRLDQLRLAKIHPWIPSFGSRVSESVTVDRHHSDSHPFGCGPGKGRTHHPFEGYRKGRPRDHRGFLNRQPRSEPNRTAKKLFQFHWLSKKKSIEWLSAWILADEHGPVLLLCEGDRPNRPCQIELVPQREFEL
jgi:hypothetical protein